MSDKIFKYILDFQAKTEKFNKEVGGMQGLMKGAAVAAGALFAADKIIEGAQAVAEYAQEIAKVQTNIATLTGIQGDALNQVTGQVQALAQSYDEDVNETIQATNVLMREFGADSQKTFDILNAGFASTANSNEDFLQQVREYSTHFREAGASAEQMLAVIAEGNKTGVFDDKAADSIKEGSIRLREMTQGTQDALNAIGLSSTQIQREISSGNKSMFEVMQLVSRQLQTLPQQSPAVGQALADIFGGPGEDAVNFIRSLADMDLTMQGVVDNATQAQMNWTAELAEFHTVGAEVFGGTDKMMLRVKTTMLSWVNEGMKGIVSLVNYFIDLYNESMVFRGAIEYVKAVFVTNFDLMKTVVADFWDRLKNVGRLVKAVFTGDFESIPEILKNTFASSIDNYKEFGKKAANNFSQAIENTLNPRKKIELISLSTEAEAAGVDAGERFAAAFSNSAAVIQERDTTTYKTIKPRYDIEDLSPKLNLEAMQSQMPVYQAMMESMRQQQDEAIEKQLLFQQAFDQGFTALGETVVKGLGLAEHGLQGFIGVLVQTAVQAIAAYEAQALAAAILGSQEAAAATGPLAIFTSSTFLATMIGGVMAAFAAIPKFQFGGIARASSGTSTLGDKMLIRVNPGEEILRTDDPRHANNYGNAVAYSGGRDRFIFSQAVFGRDGLYLMMKEAEQDFQKLT